MWCSLSKWFAPSQVVCSFKISHMNIFLSAPHILLDCFSFFFLQLSYHSLFLFAPLINKFVGNRFVIANRYILD